MMAWAGILRIFAVQHGSAVPIGGLSAAEKPRVNPPDLR
jgi:hypothetical protein